jgi:hypothetical protein
MGEVVGMFWNKSLRNWSYCDIGLWVLSQCIRYISRYMPTTSNKDTFAKQMYRFQLGIELSLAFQDKVTIFPREIVF